MRTLTANTCALLQTFGGRLCVLGKIGYIDGKKQDVSLPANTTLEEICASARYGFSCEDGNSVLTARRGKGGEFLFVKNLSRTEKSRVRIEGAGEKYVALDLETLEERPLAGDGIVLGGAESAILLRAESSPVPVRESAADVTAAFRVAGMTENFLVLDYAQIAREGGAFGARRRSRRCSKNCCARTTRARCGCGRPSPSPSRCRSPSSWKRRRSLPRR